MALGRYVMYYRKNSLIHLLYCTILLLGFNMQGVEDILDCCFTRTIFHMSANEAENDALLITTGGGYF